MINVLKSCQHAACFSDMQRKTWNMKRENFLPSPEVIQAAIPGLAYEYYMNIFLQVIYHANIQAL